MPQDNFDIHEWRLYQSNLNLLTEQDEDDDFNITTDSFDVVELGIGDTITPDMWNNKYNLSDLQKIPQQIIGFNHDEPDGYGMYIVLNTPDGYTFDMEYPDINTLLKPQYQVITPLNEQDEEDDFNLDLGDNWNEKELSVGDFYNEYTGKVYSSEDEIPDGKFKVLSYKVLYIGPNKGKYKKKDIRDTDIITVQLLNTNDRYTITVDYFNREFGPKINGMINLNEQDKDDDFNITTDAFDVTELGVGDTITPDMWVEFYPDNYFRFQNVPSKIIGFEEDEDGVTQVIIKFKDNTHNGYFTRNINIDDLNDSLKPQYKIYSSLTEEDDDFNITVGDNWNIGEELGVGDKITPDMFKSPKEDSLDSYNFEIISFQPNNKVYLRSLKKGWEDVFKISGINELLKPEYQISPFLTEQDEDEFDITTDSFDTIGIGSTITPDMWKEDKMKEHLKFYSQPQPKNTYFSFKDVYDRYKRLSTEDHIVTDIFKVKGSDSLYLKLTTLDGRNEQPENAFFLKPEYNSKVEEPLREQDEDDDFNITTDSFDVVELEVGDIITPDMWVPIEGNPGYDRLFRNSPNIVGVIKSIYGKPQKIKRIQWDDLGQEFRFNFEDGSEFWQSDLKPKYKITPLINEQDEDDDFNITTDSFDELELTKGDSITPEMWDLDNLDLDSYIDDPDEDWVIKRFNKFGDVELQTETGGHVITSIESINGVLKPKYKIVKSLNELLDLDDDDWNITTDSFDERELSLGDFITPKMFQNNEYGDAFRKLNQDFKIVKIKTSNNTLPDGRANPLYLVDIEYLDNRGKLRRDNHHVTTFNERFLKPEFKIVPPLNEQDDDDFNITVGDEWNIKDLGVGDIITPDMWKDDIDNTTENVLIRNNVWEIYQMGDYEGIPTLKIKDDNRQIRGYTVRYLNDMLNPQFQIVPNLTEQDEDDDFNITVGDNWNVKDLGVGDFITPDMWRKVRNVSSNIWEIKFIEYHDGYLVVELRNDNDDNHLNDVSYINSLLLPQYQIVPSNDLNEQDEDDFNITTDSFDVQELSVGDVITPNMWNKNLSPEYNDINDWIDNPNENQIIDDVYNSDSGGVGVVFTGDKTNIQNAYSLTDFNKLLDPKFQVILSLNEQDEDDDFNITVGDNWNLSSEEEKLLQYYNDEWEKIDGNLVIKGYLDLYNKPIISLPDNLQVEGFLDLSNTKITSLPNNLKVGGDLYLNSTKITSLPDNLKVGGDLNINNTPITSLPNNLQVGGDIIGFEPSLNELLDSDDDFNLDLGPEWGFTELRMGDIITPDMWDQEKLNSPGQFVITNPGWFLLPHKITNYRESFSTFITFDKGTKRLSEKFVKSFLKDNVKLDL